MTWTHDRYGIPWKLVCFDCEDRTNAYIAGWTFDPADAGETLEESDAE